MTAAVKVMPCLPEFRAEALKLVLRELTPEQQVALVASLKPPANRSGDPFDTLIIAEKERRVIAATWAQVQPGRIATLWRPQFLETHEETAARELITAATMEARYFDITMLQAILLYEDSKAAQSLLAAGFTHAADLIYLEWIPIKSAANPPLRLHFEPFQERHHDRLAKLLEQTYRGSLDCPVLDSIRSLDDTIEGYRATGDYNPNLWFFVGDGTQDMGVVLLTKYSDTRQMELIYMGIVPFARGRGYGAELLRHTQQIAIERKCNKLLLAVDAANSFALQIYREAGFCEWSRRSVYLFDFARVG